MNNQEDGLRMVNLQKVRLRMEEYRSYRVLPYLPDDGEANGSFRPSFYQA